MPWQAQGHGAQWGTPPTPGAALHGPRPMPVARQGPLLANPRGFRIRPSPGISVLVPPLARLMAQPLRRCIGVHGHCNHLFRWLLIRQHPRVLVFRIRFPRKPVPMAPRYPDTPVITRQTRQNKKTEKQNKGRFFWCCHNRLYLAT